MAECVKIYKNVYHPLQNVSGFTNMYDEVKTKHWNRPKVVQSLKELEKIPTQRSKRICKLQKEKDRVIRELVTFVCDGNVLVGNLGGEGPGREVGWVGGR